uniref:GIY-YIG domain-containing protein n=1 Tax=Magnetococcus massalia (strain MO-1) TaxID=451514 RepID=A0A1S7LGM6_MAGMO|nr:conserved protein of unknown function [Candidatus Magnetococcus massalia]
MPTYIIELRVKRRTTVTVGALGPLTFGRGRYIYVGSAKKNWHHRIARHLATDKKLRWHADYLTSHPDIQPERAWLSMQDHECSTARALLALATIEAAAHRIGASDCNCPAHLLKVAGIRAVRNHFKALDYHPWKPPC